MYVTLSTILDWPVIKAILGLIAFPLLYCFSKIVILTGKRYQMVVRFMVPSCCVVYGCHLVVWFMGAILLCGLWVPSCCVVYGAILLCGLWVPSCCGVYGCHLVVWFMGAILLCGLGVPSCCVV